MEMKYLFIFIHSIIYHFVFKMDFFQSLFNSWNLAYPISTEDPNDDNNIIVLFNSIASESPVPLVCIHPIDLMKRKTFFFRKLFGLNPCHRMIINQLFIFIYYIPVIHRFFFVFINYFLRKN